MGRVGDIADLLMLGVIGVVGYAGYRAYKGLEDWKLPSLEVALPPQWQWMPPADTPAAQTPTTKRVMGGPQGIVTAVLKGGNDAGGSTKAGGSRGFVGALGGKQVSRVPAGMGGSRGFVGALGGKQVSRVPAGMGGGGAGVRGSTRSSLWKGTGVGKRVSHTLVNNIVPTGAEKVTFAALKTYAKPSPVGRIDLGPVIPQIFRTGAERLIK